MGGERRSKKNSQRNQRTKTEFLLKMRQTTLIIFAVIVAMAAAQDCFLRDYAYTSNIMVSGKHNLQDTPEACQLSCQEITGCTHWTWLPDNMYCELKDQTFALPYPGAVSGPRSC